MSDERRAGRGRLSLLLIAAVAAAPVVAAYILFHLWRPSAFTNYGQLLPPAPIADVLGVAALGVAVAGSKLRR